MHALCMRLGSGVEPFWRDYNAGLAYGKKSVQGIVKCQPAPSFPPSQDLALGTGKKEGREAGWLPACGDSVPMTHLPHLEAVRPPYLLLPVSSTASALGQIQRADPSVPGQNTRPGWGSPRPLQHHGAKLQLPPALGSPGGGSCGLQHGRDLSSHPSGLPGEQR